MKSSSITLSKFAEIARRLTGHPWIDISEEYIDWLCWANATAGFHRGHLYCFDYAIRNLPSQAPIVEIGVFCGLSTNLLTYYKERHGVRNPLICCDKWQFEWAREGSVGKSSISHSEYRTFVKESYIRNVQIFSRYDLPYPMEMLSDEFFTAWRKSDKHPDVFGRPVQLGGPISFCYIDGNHSYEYAKRDFENCHAFLERGGFVLFDDSDFPGVRPVISEVRASGNYELVIRNPNYLFKKIKS